MKINLDRAILDPRGNPVRDGEGNLTLGTVVMTAMFAQIPDDQNVSSDQKIKFYKLAMSASKGGVAPFTTEELSMVKQRVGRVYGALVVGRVYEIIEGEGDESGGVANGRDLLMPGGMPGSGPGPRSRLS